MNTINLYIVVGICLLGSVFTGCASSNGKAFLYADTPIVSEIGTKGAVRSLSVKDELAMLDNEVSVSTRFSPETGFIEISLVNAGKAPARILWPESSIMVGGENPLRPIPLAQLQSNREQATSSATATVIPPGGHYRDQVTAIERTSTNPSYTKITRGFRTVGRFQSGTYLSIGGIVDSGVNFTSVTSNREDDGSASYYRGHTSFRSDEEWTTAVKSILEKRYLNKKILFMPVIEVAGVKRTLSVSMTINRVETKLED